MRVQRISRGNHKLRGWAFPFGECGLPRLRSRNFRRSFVRKGSSPRIMCRSQPVEDARHRRCTPPLGAAAECRGRNITVQIIFFGGGRLLYVSLCRKCGSLIEEVHNSAAACKGRRYCGPPQAGGGRYVIAGGGEKSGRYRGKTMNFIFFRSYIQGIGELEFGSLQWTTRKSWRAAATGCGGPHDAFLRRQRPEVKALFTIVPLKPATAGQFAMKLRPTREKSAVPISFLILKELYRGSRQSSAEVVHPRRNPGRESLADIPLGISSDVE